MTLLAQWNIVKNVLIRYNIINEEKDKIKIKLDKNIQAHKNRINAIEIDQRLGLIITCGKDNLVQIRKLYNLELILPISIKKKKKARIKV